MITDLKINEERKRYYYEQGFWGTDTLLDVWNARLTRFAEREYVADDQGSRFTYGQIDQAAARFASWLDEAGVRAGDVVSFQFPTWAEFCVVYVACLKVGAVMHPLPRNFNDADLTYIMNLVETKAFVCPTRFRNVDYEQQALSVRDDIPSLSAIAVVDKFEPAHAGLPALSEICSSYEPFARTPEVSSDDVACILSTSGTTGKQKAVLLTHNNMLFSERSFCRAAERTQDDVMFMASPLNHAVGFWHGLVSPMILGGRSVLMQDFKPDAAIRLMNAEKCTWSMGATPFIYDMLKCIEHEGGPAIETLELFLCGGAPVPSRLVKCAHAHGVNLCEIYGSTESCPHVYVPPRDCLEWNGAWSGIPYEGIEIKIVDACGNEVPRGEQGEEISRGPHQFVGYLNERERTDRVLDDEGWFHSGDLGYMDEEGRLRINGRKKEIIIRGGENICAREIDDDLIGCPGIAETATIGMPDERLGERICTFAVPTGDARPSLGEVTAYLAGKHVAKRLWPERIEYIERIPKTPTGKVKRFVLSDELDKRMGK
ncbi:MAG: medium-chain fatty-acid--CoA ligase [Eggerthellaceae bacterium]|nr:medium-chain fatty-acid--CoA ligase [Eggerthellaceae bacterium]